MVRTRSNDRLALKFVNNSHVYTTSTQFQVRRICFLEYVAMVLMYPIRAQVKEQQKTTLQE